MNEDDRPMWMDIDGTQYYFPDQDDGNGFGSLPPWAVLLLVLAVVTVVAVASMVVILP